MYKKIILLTAFILCAVSVHAQWSAGISAGWDYNWPSINKGYATDVLYNGQPGFDISVAGRYQFRDWFAVRADIRMDMRNYSMKRNYYYLKDVHTDHKDAYLHIPVVADFSFGGKKLRGHCYLGGYAGYWLNAHRSGVSIQENTEIIGGGTTAFEEDMEFDSRRDRRFNAGLTGGVGLSYIFARNWEIFAETLLMYDLTTSNVTYIVANPRYNSTLCLNIGAMYKF